MLKPEDVTAIVDTREQNALDLSPLRIETGALPTGDYSVKGLEHIVSLERKSLGDLLACCGRERERFDKEIQRLAAYPCRALIVEATWSDIEFGQWRSQLTPQHVTGSLCGWIAGGLPVVMAGDHARAGRIAARILFIAARRRLREVQSFYQEVTACPRPHDDVSHAAVPACRPAPTGNAPNAGG